MEEEQINSQPSDEQSQIINAPPNDDLKVIAPPGSGKTFTLLMKIIRLINYYGVDPQRIFITTFNVEAAKMMKQRLCSSLDTSVVDQITIGNIDSLAHQFIQKIYAQQFGGQTLQYICKKEYCTEFLRIIKTPEGKKSIQNYRYFFFDEFQDINDMQYNILLEFKKAGCFITVVGDDAQNIYEFRKSRVELLQTEIQKDIPNIKTLYLTVNYRQTQPLISLANMIVKNSKRLIPKKMVASPKQQQANQKQDLPELIDCDNITQVNQSIISKLVDWIHKQKIMPSNIVVLSRKKIQLYFLEADIEQYNINNPQKQILIFPMLDDFEDRSSYQDQMLDQNKQQKVTDAKQQRVAVTTIHKCKGKEWDNVILFTVNDETIPGMRANSEKDIEAERRIFFVAITRAKTKLIMYMTRKQTQQKLSRFLIEIIESQKLEQNKLILFNQENLIKSKSLELNQNQSTSNQYQFNGSNAVTKIIENLEETVYQNLRQLQIIPNELKSQLQHYQIYQGLSLSQDILDNQLHAEFGAFIDRYIQRLVAEKFQNYNFLDSYAQCMLSTYQNKYEYAVGNYLYKNHRQQLEQMIGDISIEQAYQQKQNYIDQIKNQILQGNENKYESIKQLERDADYVFKACLDQILERYIAYCYNEDYEVENSDETRYQKENSKYKYIRQSYQDYFKDYYQKTENIMPHILNVSIWANIYEYRERLLYKKGVFEILYSEDYQRNLFNSGIQHKFIEELQKIKHGLQDQCQIKNKLYLYNQEYDINGEIDLVFGDTIFQFKVSTRDQETIPLEWLLQMLIYAALYRHSAYNDSQKIKYIALFNSLRGTITKFDISGWNKEKELLQLLKDSTLGDRKENKQQTAIDQNSTQSDINQTAALEQTNQVQQTLTEGAIESQMLLEHKKTENQIQAHSQYRVEPLKDQETQQIMQDKQENLKQMQLISSEGTDSIIQSEFVQNQTSQLIGMMHSSTTANNSNHQPQQCSNQFPIQLDLEGDNNEDEDEDEEDDDEEEIQDIHIEQKGQQKTNQIEQLQQQNAPLPLKKKKIKKSRIKIDMNEK